MEGADGPGQKVGESSALAEGGRLHVQIEGRYITVLRIGGELFAIDSVCFHAGGPLGTGDIEDLNGKTCIVCPWHYYKIDVKTGEKYYQAIKMENGKMAPGEWLSNGKKQRVHKASESDGSIFVHLAKTGHVESDEYACNAQCGGRVMSSAPRLMAVGADGKKPSGGLASR